MTFRRGLLWVLLGLPGGWIVWRWAMTPAAYGMGHAIKDSGDWAAWLLLATLAVTPLRLALGTNALTRWLLLRRRELGVASFAYAAAHTAIYLYDKADAARVLAEASGIDLMTGWLALALFAPLAATSNDASLRALKRRWKSLHRLVHPAAVLVFAHWALTAYDPLVAYGHIAILAVIETARIALPRARRQSVV